MRTRVFCGSITVLLLGLMLCGVLTSNSAAQVPRMINYQGRLTDDTGQVVTDGEYPVRFRIWDDSTDGMVKWTSQPETVLVINGLFNFQLGSKENIPPSTFNDTSLWLGITVGTGPEVPEIEPRTRLVSVPYAFKAHQSLRSDTAEHAVACSGETGTFDGEVNSDMIEDSGINTVFNFESPFTTIEKPHMYIVVVLKEAADGLVEGAAIKAVVDIKGAPGNWTGFDITVSKYSGGSISDTTQVFVIWMAIARW